MVSGQRPLPTEPWPHSACGLMAGGGEGGGRGGGGEGDGRGGGRKQGPDRHTVGPQCVAAAQGRGREKGSQRCCGG